MSVSSRLIKDYTVPKIELDLELVHARQQQSAQMIQNHLFPKKRKPYERVMYIGREYQDFDISIPQSQIFQLPQPVRPPTLQNKRQFLDKINEGNVAYIPTQRRVMFLIDLEERVNRIFRQLFNQDIPLHELIAGWGLYNDQPINQEQLQLLENNPQEYNQIKARQYQNFVNDRNRRWQNFLEEMRERFNNFDWQAQLNFLSHYEHWIDTDNLALLRSIQQFFEQVLRQIEIKVQSGKRISQMQFQRAMTVIFQFEDFKNSVRNESIQSQRRKAQDQLDKQLHEYKQMYSDQKQQMLDMMQTGYIYDRQWLQYPTKDFPLETNSDWRKFLYFSTQLFRGLIYEQVVGYQSVFDIMMVTDNTIFYDQVDSKDFQQIKEYRTRSFNMFGLISIQQWALKFLTMDNQSLIENMYYRVSTMKTNVIQYTIVKTIYKQKMQKMFSVEGQRFNLNPNPNMEGGENQMDQQQVRQIQGFELAVNDDEDNLPEIGGGRIRIHRRPPFPYVKIIYVLLLQNYYRGLMIYRYLAYMRTMFPDFGGKEAVQYLANWDKLYFTVFITPKFISSRNSKEVAFTERIEVVVLNQHQKYRRGNNINIMNWGLPSKRFETGVRTIKDLDEQFVLNINGLGSIFVALYYAAYNCFRDFLSLAEIQDRQKYNYIEQKRWVQVYINVERNTDIQFLNLENSRNMDHFSQFFYWTLKRNVLNENTVQRIWYVFEKQKIQGQCDDYIKYIEKLQNFVSNDRYVYRNLHCWKYVLVYLSKGVRQPSFVQKFIHNNKDAGFQKIFRELIDQFGVGYVFIDATHNRKFTNHKNVLLFQGRHVSLGLTDYWKLRLNKEEQIPKYITGKATAIKSRLEKEIEQKRRQYQNPNAWRLKGSKVLIGQYQKKFYEKNKQLSLDVQSIYEFVLRKNSLWVDIQCLAVEQQVQECYHYKAFGYFDDYMEQIQFEHWDTQNFRADEHFCNKLKEYLDIRCFTPKNPLIIWTFNGLKYQMSYFLRHLLKKFFVVGTYGLPSQSKGFSIKQGSVIFRDIRLLLPMGSLGQLTNVTYDTFIKKELKEVIDIAQMKTKQQVQENKSLIMKYCRQDVLSSMYLTTKFYTKMFELIKNVERQKSDRSFEPISLCDIYSKMTVPSIALLIYKRLFLRQRYVTDKQPQLIKNLQRKFYKGGISYVNKYIIDQDVYAFDINSSYPFAMTQDLPWYYVGEKVGENRQIQDLDYCEVFQFDLPENMFNFIPIKHKQGLFYPEAHKFEENDKLYLWGFEVKYIGLQNVRLGKIFSYSCFEPNPLKEQKEKNESMKEYVETFYPMKSTEQDPTKKNLIKLLLNSLYGKFGQKSFSDIKLYDRDYGGQLNLYVFQTDGVQVEDLDVYTLRKQAKEQTGAGLFVRVAAFITAFARLKLASTATMIGVENVYYCDTDSLYVNQTGRQRFFDLNLTDPNKLGYWKQQGSYKSGCFFSSKHAILQKKNICTVCRIDGKILVDDKLKWCSKCFKIRGKCYDVKWKGVNRNILRMNDLEQVLKDGIDQLRRYYADSLNGTLLYFKPLYLLDQVAAVRWKKKRQGIAIENFQRKTNTIFKRRLTSYNCETKGFRYYDDNLIQ